MYTRVKGKERERERTLSKRSPLHKSKPILSAIIKFSQKIAKDAWNTCRCKINDLRINYFVDLFMLKRLLFHTMDLQKRIYIYIYIYIKQLEENSNLFKLSLEIYFGEEYQYTLRLTRWLHTFNFILKKSKYWLQSICIKKNYINLNSHGKVKGVKTIKY